MRRLLNKLCRRSIERASLAGQAVLGEIQRSAGLPLSFVGTHRQAVEQWKQELGQPIAPKGRVLITALRNRSWIGFGAYAACVLRLHGYESTVLFRGSDLARLYPSRHPRFSFWRGVEGIPGIELVDVEEIAVTQAQMAEFEECARRAAPSVLAYDRHIEEQDILAGDGETKAALEGVIAMMAQMGAATQQIFERRRYHRFLLYSGLIGESPTMLESARRLGVQTICLEGWGWRPGHMIYNLGAPALDYNVAGWMRSLGPWDAAKESEVNAYLKFLDGEKHDGEWLNNFYRIQRDKLSETLPADLRAFLAGEPPVFVLAPNVIGDSSTLGRETIFGGQQVWMAEVIQWFAVRPHLKLVIRAHPGERWMGGKCVIHLGAVARKLAAGRPNIHVIDSAESVNTFSLVPFARAGLVWLSSAGVDFAVRGLPAVVAARPKYTGLGIVEEPATREDYFALLERWAVRAERPTAEQMTQGKRYLHMVFKGFSFEATGRDYTATSLRLGAMPNQPEHDRFFRILVGAEPMPDVA